MAVIPIALTSGAVAAVWLTLLVRVLGLYGGCMVLVVVASCFGYDFFNTKVGPLPISADRVLLAALVGLYFLQRLFHRLKPKPLGAADVLFGLFLAVLTVSTFSHDWKWRESQPLASLLFLYFVPATLYWLVRESISGERGIRGLFLTLALFGLYIALTAILEVCQLYSLVFPRYIVTSTYTEWIGRARGPFLNPTTNGIFLSASVFAWAMYWPRARGIGRILVLAGMAITTVGVLCTLTRSCWMAFAIGMGTILLASLPRNIRVPAILLSCVVGTLLLTVGRDSLKSFKRDKNVSQFHMEQSAKLRPVLAAVAWSIFKDYPIFGVGYGQYKRVDIDYLHDPNTDLPLEQAKGFVQHNLFLGVLVDMGLVGLVVYSALMLTWWRRGWQLWNDTQRSLCERQVGLLLVAILIQFCVNGMFHDVSLPTNGNLLLFLTAGVCQGTWLLRQNSSEQNPLSNLHALAAGAGPDWNRERRTDRG